MSDSVNGWCAASTCAPDATDAELSCQRACALLKFLSSTSLVSAMTKPPPSMIDALERPRCPRCGVRMAFAGVAPGSSEEFETRKFECSKCGTAKDCQVAKDPIQDAMKWLNSALQPPK